MSTATSQNYVSTHTEAAGPGILTAYARNVELKNSTHPGPSHLNFTKLPASLWIDPPIAIGAPVWKSIYQMRWSRQKKLQRKIDSIVKLLDTSVEQWFLKVQMLCTTIMPCEHRCPFVSWRGYLIWPRGRHLCPNNMRDTYTSEIYKNTRLTFLIYSS